MNKSQKLQSEPLLDGLNNVDLENEADLDEICVSIPFNQDDVMLQVERLLGELFEFFEVPQNGDLNAMLDDAQSKFSKIKKNHPNFQSLASAINALAKQRKIIEANTQIFEIAKQIDRQINQGVDIPGYTRVEDINEIDIPEAAPIHYTQQRIPNLFHDYKIAQEQRLVSASRQLKITIAIAVLLFVLLISVFIFH